MTVHGDVHLAFAVVAAMEPAEYRPDDVVNLSTMVNGQGPQWSRPSIGRMTALRRVRRGRRQLAAMEPAEYRPDDLLPPRRRP